MRDPATRSDSKLESALADLDADPLPDAGVRGASIAARRTIDEWAIEFTRQFLEPRVNYIDWRGDPGRKAIALHDALMEIENRSLSEGAKVLVRKLIIDEMKKRRRGQPTRRFRDLSLAKAARRLMNQGYNPSRNDEMRDRECGARKKRSLVLV
jgi:hypothetical protein